MLRRAADQLALAAAESRSQSSWWSWRGIHFETSRTKSNERILFFFKGREFCREFCVSWKQFL